MHACVMVDERKTEEKMFELGPILQLRQPQDRRGVPPSSPPQLLDTGVVGRVLQCVSDVWTTPNSAHSEKNHNTTLQILQFLQYSSNL